MAEHKLLPPKNYWYVLALSTEVGSKPASFKIFNKSIVLVRLQNQLCAYEDRCPHKGVSLSLGHVDENKNLRCKYHGWSFDNQGNLAQIPCDTPEVRLPKCKLKSYPVSEQDGLIWIYPDTESTPILPAPRYEKLKKTSWWDYVNTYNSTTSLILENAFDCSHTGFVHPGLFRSEPSHYVDVFVEETSTGMKATTSNEKKGNKWDPRRLLVSDNDISHSDEFVLPHTVVVDYTYGPTKFYTYLFCSPVDENHSRTFIRIGMKVPFISFLLKPIFYLWIKTVIAQDKIILENQLQNLNQDPKPFQNVTADVPAMWLTKTYNKVCLNLSLTTDKKTSIKYKL